ncbi:MULTISPECIES: helix-turn-helix transcriptional regulator [Rhodopseudomonas]|uniref:helix-turn-helix transcriptional regulator n=1 Tax=Rhodopseudomonas TaxID=1073 RepID=UPI001ABFBA6D|nr:MULTISPECIES: helix-turn-helix domain-containing protein [Rhodopseudomonas]
MDTTSSNPEARSEASLSDRFTLGKVARLDPETLLVEAEVAEVLRVSVRTLQRWRSTGEGPRVSKIGPRRISYTAAAVLAYAGVSQPAAAA